MAGTQRPEEQLVIGRKGTPRASIAGVIPPVALLLVALASSHGPAAAAPLAPHTAQGRNAEPPRSDFNGDGFSDLAVGAYGDGFIVVLYGSPRGLTTFGRQLITADWFGDSIAAGGQFGAALAAGDFDGDHFADLAIGDLWTHTNMGAFYVLYGSPEGLTRAGSEVWDFGSPGLKGRRSIGDDLGSRLVTGNFGRGPEDDLAVSAPEKGVAGGAVLVLYGSPTGLSAAGNQLLNLDSRGVKGFARYSVSFGDRLAAGNFGRGPYDDLAISWYKRVDGFDNSGAVSVLYGSPSGLMGARSQLWTAESPGLDARAGIAFDFGAGLAAGNFGRGHLDDLAISAAGETVGGKRYAGAMYVIYGSRAGLTATHAQRWTQSSPFIAGTPEKEGWFPGALVAADFGRGPQDDLAAGQSFATVGHYRRAGEIHVLFGTPTGLRARGGQLWTLDSPGVHGNARAKRQFGAVGCAADFGRGRWDELVEEEADQPPHNSYGPGAVQVLYGSPRGLSGAGVQRWREGEHRIPGPRTSYDLFGSVACG